MYCEVFLVTTRVCQVILFLVPIFHTILKLQNEQWALFFFSKPFFSIRGFFRMTFMIHRTVGQGGG